MHLAAIMHDAEVFLHAGLATRAPAIRPRRQRPRRRRAAEEGDERASLDHSITSSAMVSSSGGTSMPSSLAVWWLMTNSNFDAWTTGTSAGFAPLRMRPV